MQTWAIFSNCCGNFRWQFMAMQLHVTAHIGGNAIYVPGAKLCYVKLVAMQELRLLLVVPQPIATGAVWAWLQGCTGSGSGSGSTSYPRDKVQ